jgi:hypothetical protein
VVVARVWRRDLFVHEGIRFCRNCAGDEPGALASEGGRSADLGACDGMPFVFSWGQEDYSRFRNGPQGARLLYRVSILTVPPTPKAQCGGNWLSLALGLSRCRGARTRYPVSDSGCKSIRRSESCWLVVRDAGLDRKCYQISRVAITQLSK